MTTLLRLLVLALAVLPVLAAGRGRRSGAGAVVVSLAMVNGGRGTLTQATTLWGNLAEASGRLHVDVIVAVEVDEGDKPAADHRLVRQLLAGWSRPVFRRSREVILLREGLPVLAAKVRAAGASVAHWSPRRAVSKVRTHIGPAAGPDITVLTCHPAAGAQGHQVQHRPTWARPLLLASWVATVARLIAMIMTAHTRGDHALVALDANSRTFITYLHRHLPKKLAAQLVVLVDAAPDYVVAVPADGWKVTGVERHEFANPIEPGLHPGHIVVATFEPATIP